MAATRWIGARDSATPRGPHLAVEDSPQRASHARAHGHHKHKRRHVHRHAFLRGDRRARGRHDHDHDQDHAHSAEAILGPAHQFRDLEPGEKLRREDLQGTWAMERERRLDDPKSREKSEMAKEYGLEAAPSIKDRSLTLFNRRRIGAYGGGTFLGSDFLEDARKLGGQDVCVVGAPFDGGTTYRPGTRFGPAGLRKMSNFGGYGSGDRGMLLGETLNIVDIGDIQVIPANIEKSFDQIALACGYIHERAVFPVVLGGDHSIGYPDIRGLAPYINGNIGIIHFDRHSDLSESSLDERMHGSPFFHATNIPNAPATNLVQIGIGGWTGGKGGMKVARERRATVITMADIDHYGIERVVEYALDVAWNNAKAVWLSFDIDSCDPAFAPGTGTPEPGGLLPREVYRLLRLICREGLTGMELVEVAPPYDVADLTSLLGSRIIMDVLCTLVEAGKLGRIPPPPAPKPEGEADSERRA